MNVKPSNVPLVSVAITTYNQKNFIRECIDSVLVQDYPNIEIVVADDASTDLTQDILNDYVDKYPNKFILKFSDTNQGVTKNANKAFFSCSGKYIAWLGGDDLMLPGKISAQVAWMEKDNKRMICGHILQLCDQFGHVFGIHKKKLASGVGAAEWVERGNLYGAPSFMMRRGNMPKYGFDERLSTVSDWKLCIDTLQHDSVYGYLNQIYGVYRKHESNISRNAEVISAEADLTLELVGKERPELLGSIRKGRSLVVYYGKGNQFRNAGKNKFAIRCFWASIKLQPFQWRSYVRVLQIVMSTVRPLKNQLK